MIDMERYFSTKQFLKSTDFKKPLTLTVAGTSELKQRGREKPQLLLQFRETDKSLGLNKGNLLRMTELHGGEEGRWIGKKITLIHEMREDLEGKKVQGIAIR